MCLSIVKRAEGGSRYLDTLLLCTCHSETQPSKQRRKSGVHADTGSPLASRARTWVAVVQAACGCTVMRAAAGDRWAKARRAGRCAGFGSNAWTLYLCASGVLRRNCCTDCPRLLPRSTYMKRILCSGQELVAEQQWVPCRGHR